MFSATGIITAFAILAIGVSLIDTTPAPPSVGSGTTHVVAADGTGDFDTIGAAVDAAADGDTVLVRPGTYTEAIVIDKDITLMGEGAIEEIVIMAPEDGPTMPIEEGGFYEDPYAILLQETVATLSNVTFRGQPSEVIASGGAPILDGLTFDRTGYSFDGTTSSPAGSSIVVNRGSAATIRDSFITAGGPIGVFDGSTPLIEGNTLTGGPHIYGFGFGDGSAIRDNSIRGTLVRGIGTFRDSGAILIEGNTIASPGRTGIEVDAGAATVRGNIVHGADSIAIQLGAEGGMVVGNEVSDSGTAIMLSSGQGVVAENVIRGGWTGIGPISGAVELTGNDVEGVERVGISITRGSPILRDNRSCGNGENLFVTDRATPDIDDSNEICEDASVE